MKIAQILRDFSEADGTLNDGVATIQGVNVIVFNIIAIALGLGGIATFIMLIIGGYKLITSAGDPKVAAAAKQTITYAILGIVLLAVSFLILQFIGTLTGQVGLTEFNIVYD